MIDTDLKKFDRQVRKELGVPASAWINDVGPSKIEVRIGENLDALASAENEGERWAVRTAEGLTFVGTDTQARHLLWAAACAVPRRPSPTAPKSASPRQPWDYYSGGAA